MSIIVAGPASKNLAYNIAKITGFECLDVESKIFPDGEIKITIPDSDRLNDKHVIIIQSTHPPVNQHLIQLIFILGKVREHTSKITLIIPYLAYARQDREFLKGEGVSINYLSTIFDAFNVKNVITVDIHSTLALSYIRNGINVSAVPLLAEWFKNIEGIVVSPDLGGKERAKTFAALTNREVIVLQKVRDRVSGEVSVKDISIELENKNIIIVDDMISTGNSIIKSIEILRGRCKDIYIACTHALLLEDAYSRIKNAGVIDIVATNTVESIASKVDVSYLLKDTINNLTHK